MADRLINLGCIVSDKNLVIYTINDLESRFATLVEIIRHRETLPSFENVCTMLLLKESSFNDDSGSSTILQVARRHQRFSWHPTHRTTEEEEKKEGTSFPTNNMQDEAHVDSDENQTSYDEVPNEELIEESPSPPLRKFRSLSEIYNANFCHVEKESFEEEDSWNKATEDEIQVIKKNNTWELTDVPLDSYWGQMGLHSQVQCRWFFQRNKPRLVEKGYSQQPGIHYDETFALVARMDMGRAIISLARFEVEGKEEKIYKLKKALYGLKQASRACYSQIDGYFKVKGLDKSKSEPTLYVKNQVSASIGLKVGTSEKENKAMELLRTLWEYIVKLPKKDIDDILRGPPDLTESGPGRLVQTIQLNKLISKHLDKLQEDSLKIINDPEQVSKLKNLISEHVVNMHVETQTLIKQGSKIASGTGDEAQEIQNRISEHIMILHDATQKLINKEAEKEDLAQDVQKLISRYIDDVRVETYTRKKYSSGVLFIAAEMGNTNFLIELIRRYPDLIWKIGAMKDMITPMRDRQDNNMLHLVGKTVNRRQLERVSGVALDMQRELLWFQEVESIIPPSYWDQKNSDGLTPHQLFTKEHKDMVTQGEKQIKEIASQCMVVAALVATMVFAAAFTAPGGYDQDSGIPIFHSKTTFKIFVVADAISLFSSSASILYMFLSVFTSRYAEVDFLESLPRKFTSIRGVQVGLKVGFKPTKQVYTPVSNKISVGTSGKKKQAEFSSQKVSNSNPFEALNSIEDDDDLGTNGGNSKSVGNGSLNVGHGSSSNIPIIIENIDKLERQILDGKLTFVDDDGKPF
ncbi:ankyrin repeat-containing domain, PGG domain protein [Tanacetum coccineum]